LPSSYPKATPIAACHMTKRWKSPSTRTTRPKEISISLKPGAVFRWMDRMVLRADCAEYSSQCEELAGSTPTDDSTIHKDAGKKCMKEDEAVVQRIAGVVPNFVI